MCAEAASPVGCSLRTPPDLAISANGRRAPNAAFGLEREDLQRLYPFVAHALYSGFSAQFDTHEDAPELVFEIHSGGGAIAGLGAFFVRTGLDSLLRI